MGDRLGDYRIERMSLPDVEIAIDWASRDGIPASTTTPASMPSTKGFFSGVIDGQTIATGSAPIYDGQFAFIGLYIVEPAYRGKGYGLSLTQAMLSHGGDLNAGLDGVKAMAERYARLGFRTAHRSVRHGFIPTSRRNVTAEIVPLAQVLFAELADYDRRHFLASRANFLEAWITQPHAVALGFVDGDRLQGYGVLRQCCSGYKIGPLFAEQPEIAEALFNALCNNAIGQPVFIDMPESNQAASKLAAKYEMKPFFACQHMYLRGDPGLPIDAIFGITSFEAG